MNIDDVHKRDEVIITGELNGEEISVNSFRGMTTRLNYEVLVCIPDDLPGIVIE